MYVVHELSLSPMKPLMRLTAKRYELEHIFVVVMYVERRSAAAAARLLRGRPVLDAYLVAALGDRGITSVCRRKTFVRSLANVRHSRPSHLPTRRHPNLAPAYRTGGWARPERLIPIPELGRARLDVMYKAGRSAENPPRTEPTGHDDQDNDERLEVRHGVGVDEDSTGQRESGSLRTAESVVALAGCRSWLADHDNDRQCRHLRWMSGVDSRQLADHDPANTSHVGTWRANRLADCRQLSDLPQEGKPWTDAHRSGQTH